MESLNWDTKKVFEKFELSFDNLFGKHLVVAKMNIDIGVFKALKDAIKYPFFFAHIQHPLYRYGTC